MKLIKKSFLICLLCLLSIFAIAGISNHSSNRHAHAVESTYDFEKFTTISSFTELNETNIIKTDNYKYTIISNNSISFSFNVFAYNYNFSDMLIEDYSDFNSSFNLSFSESVSLENNTGEFEIKYQDATTIYYYTISQNELLIYTSPSKLPTSLKCSVIDNNLKFGIKYDSLTKQITYITNITYTYPEEENTLKFSVNNWQHFEFNMVKPVTKFSNQEEPVVMFNCTQNADDLEGYKPTWLPSERTYQSVTVKFFRNYTELNPLFFNINFNGFTYYYKIYTKDGLVFLQYIDDPNSTKSYEIYNNQLSTDNTLDIKFSEIGRYEIELYDLTYNTELSQEENYQNFANYYRTSFYIYDSTKSYENIYVVAESYVNEQPTEYIVSGSSETAATLNNDIRATFKNINFLSENDFKKITIKLSKTLFTGGDIYTEESFYTHEDIKLKNCYENYEEFYLDFVDDARYLIEIYYNYNYNNPSNSNPFFSTSYQVVKQPKTTFEVGEQGDSYHDLYTESKPYTKTEKEYEVPLYSQIMLEIFYKRAQDETIEVSNSIFTKEHVNKFKIFFGVSQVDIYRFARMISENGETKQASTLDIQINGVGRITATVTYNGEKTEFIFEDHEESILSFSNFGTYEIYVVDEMGTIKSASFNYQKTLNTSAILLIALSSILVLGVVIFIMRSRAKVATR